MTREARRVVITGMGAVTPSGLSAAETWNTVAAGRSAIDVLDGAEFADLPVRIGAQVRGFDPEAVIKKAVARRLSPVQWWALAAADEAMRQAEVLAGDPQAPQAHLPTAPHRFSIIAATGSGPVEAMQQATRSYLDGGPRATPLSLPIYGAPDAAAALLSQRYQSTGQAQAISATCASGAAGLGEGLRRIRHGYADAVLVVGMEDCLDPIHLTANATLRSLASGYEDDPTAASRPFDADRKGFVMGQGASAILLEAEETAHARDAAPLAQLAGYGAASDAYHPTAPHPDGAGAAAAVTDCLADAGVTPDDVDHVSAHGTGTAQGDTAEIRALETALGTRTAEIPITATKSATGHLLGAGGVVEALLAVCTLQQRRIPPTLNLDRPDFPDHDVVTGEARSAELDTVLSNSFGFGGHSGVVLLRRWQ